MAVALAPEKFDQVAEALKEVVDPELGVNIVDLGLIYDLAMDEEQVGKALDGSVDDWRLNWVWMPPWGPERITDDGREMMRALGFSI